MIAKQRKPPHIYRKIDDDVGWDIAGCVTR